jgi:ATP-binding cassette subfamily F protein 3
VSHDRYFISKIANKIWEIKEKEIKEFKGNYEEYVAWNERMAAKEAGSKQAAVNSKATGKEEMPPVKKEVAKAVPKTDKSNVQKELQKHQKQFQKLEKDVEELNKRKTELEAMLSNPDIYSNTAEFKNTENMYKDVMVKLEAATKEYEVVFEKIITLDEELLNS